MRVVALTRDNTNRIKSLPKGNNHWNWSKQPSLLTLHKRIHRRHGAAKNRKCAKCSNQARDWALIGKKYTDNIEDYQPMCRKCHTSMDKPWLKNPENLFKKGQTPKNKKNITLCK